MKFALSVYVRILAGTFALACVANNAPFTLRAADLKLIDPPVCSAITQQSAPNCTVLPAATPPGPASIQLLLTSALKTITAGGYSFQTPTYNGSFVTPVVELLPGSTLNVQLKNLLPATANAGVAASGMEESLGHTNLHTHGLIVSPQNATNTSGHGDNILVDLAPNQSFAYSIRIPASLPAGVLDSTHPISHPEGLFWYHPHLHGLSKNQVAGGMSGVLSVGRGKNLLTVNGDGGKPDPVATSSLRNATDVHYLELKDTQITTSIPPETASGSSPAQWNNDADPAYCGTIDLATVQPKNGYCSNAPAANGSIPIWLFTVNGQRYPAIDIGSGRNHLWRIANLSATATYVLQLLDGTQPVEFQVVSVDGVVAGVKDSAEGSVLAVHRKQLLLMPAGRAEIFVPNTNNSKVLKTLVLQTSGYDTGGDTWPKVNLASIRLAPSPSAAPVALRAELPRESTFVPALAEPAFAFTPKHACVRAETGYGLKPGEWRQITLDQTDTDFRIGSQVIGPNGQADPATLIVPEPFPHMFDWNTDRHLCIPFNATEIWEIQNKAPEDHNFHLHQSKFRLATKAELLKLGIKVGPLQDPTGHLSPVLIDADAGNGAGATVWHDTLPVPRAADGQHPGTIYIAVNFKAPEQIGRYVMHCHILEHEDSGMMAPIEVIQTGH